MARMKDELGREIICRLNPKTCKRISWSNKNFRYFFIKNFNKKISENKKLNIMINFDEVIEENTQQNNLYRILIVGGSGSGKTNTLLIYKTIDQTLIIFICISRIPMNPSINFISTSVSILVKKHFKDLDIFIKTLRI